MTVDHHERSDIFPVDNLLRRVLNRASLAVLRTDLQASVAIFAFTLFSSVAALSNLLQACCLTDAASVHSGVHQAGSVGRERSFRDGMNRCIPFCIVLVMLVHDCSGLSVMAEDQSKSRKNARRRPQSAWLYLHTTRLVLGSLYGQMGRSASMTAWSEAPRGARHLIFTVESKSDMIRSRMCLPRVGVTTCCSRP